MLANVVDQCPVCDGSFDAAVCTRVKTERETWTEHYFHCEFCGLGIEVSVYLDGERFMLDYRERSEPKNFRLFMDRLEAARVA